jgi:hypothetical protein
MQGAISKLRLLIAHGWPAATRSLEIESLKNGIFLLKCKPGCWRLAFHPIATKQTFLLLDAVCKKKFKRNPNDPTKARRRLDDYEAGRARGLPVTL